MHYNGLQDLRRRILPGNPLRTLYLTFGVLGINTWIWSTVFHTRGALLTPLLGLTLPLVLLQCSSPDLLLLRQL